MPRKKTRAEDIRDPERYFNKYLAGEAKNHNQQQKIIREHECSIEEKLELGHPAGLIFNAHGELFDQAGDFLDTIENEALLNGLLALSREQLMLVILLYREQLTQRQAAEMLGISQQLLHYKQQEIRKLLKKFF